MKWALLIALRVGSPPVAADVPRGQGNSDADLVRQMASGESQALADLYQRHGQALLGYVLRLAGDRGLAEEIVQDTLMAAWQSAHSFEGRSAVRTWLFGIGRRQAHNRLRTKRREWADLDSARSVATERPGPEELALAGVDRRQIAAAMRRLRPIHVEVLGLLFIDHMSYAQVSDVLQIPVGTVKSRVSHARSALAATLDAVREEK